MMEEDLSVSSTKCITKSLRDEFLVLRVDSVRVMRDATLLELWRQARIRSSSSAVEMSAERSRSLRCVRLEPLRLPPRRAGL